MPPKRNTPTHARTFYTFPLQQGRQHEARRAAARPPRPTPGSGSPTRSTPREWRAQTARARGGRRRQCLPSSLALSSAPPKGMLRAGIPPSTPREPSKNRPRGSQGEARRTMVARCVWLRRCGAGPCVRCGAATVSNNYLVPGHSSMSPQGRPVLFSCRPHEQGHTPPRQPRTQSPARRPTRPAPHGTVRLRFAA